MPSFDKFAVGYIFAQNICKTRQYSGISNIRDGAIANVSREHTVTYSQA